MKPLPDEVREALRERLREFEPYVDAAAVTRALFAIEPRQFADGKQAEVCAVCGENLANRAVPSEVRKTIAHAACNGRGWLEGEFRRLPCPGPCLNGRVVVGTVTKNVHKKPVQFVVRAWLEGSHLAAGEKIPAIPDWSTTFRFCVKCFEAAK